MSAQLFIMCVVLGMAMTPFIPANAQTTPAPKTFASESVIRITCPQSMQLTPVIPAGWDPGWGTKNLPWTSAAFDLKSGVISCLYGDSFGDALTRRVPSGYRCEAGSRGHFTCKRITPPIKLPKQ